MDKNTANYMIEEMQKEVEALNAQVDAWKQALSEKKEEVIEEATTKECPKCFSTINIKATKCPHCTSEI